MKTLLSVFIGLLLGSSAFGQVIIADNYNATPNGTGFSPGAGVNSGINPPTTRLTGSAAPNLRYILTTTTKTNTAYSITSNKLRVTSAANPGRLSLSADGTVPFDFSSTLGLTNATPQTPVIYDVAISMANNSAGTQRFSFALADAEGDATTWDFGFQLYRTDPSDNFYTIQKRVDIAASGLAADLNIFITNTVPGTFGSELSFLMRVTDAGPETSTYSSRVQLSMDAGLTWFYDTATDPDLPSGWRLGGTARYFLWDIAPDAGNATYDNFSVRSAPLSAALVSPQNNGSGLGASANLKTTVTNTSGGNVSVVFFGRETPVAGPGPDFLIPVMPDTQNYSDYTHDGLNGRFYSQTEWIITNRIRQNIPFVVQLGDVVQNGDIVNGGPNDEEWGVATNAMYRLENPARTLLRYGIPYGCCVGNHDQEPNGEPDGTTTHFNKCFGIAHFTGKPYYGGHYDTNNDNFYNLFSAGGLDFLVFSFEYDRYGSSVLGWADNIIAANPNRRIIVMTHHAGSDYTPSTMSTQGKAIYDEFKSNPNFFLMLGGHVFNGDGWGEGSRSDTFNGTVVHTLITDYQNRPSGGDGLMRLMYFSPSNNLVSMKTYSPYTDAYETDADSQFTFNYNMQPNGTGSPGTAYVALRTNTAVIPGSQNSFIWSGLQPNKTYEWYVKVTDVSGNVSYSSSRKFSTVINSAPVVTNRSLTITGDQPVLLTLTATDANSDPLTYLTNSRPVRGLNANFDPVAGTITYLPSHGYRGLDRFTYSATDGVASSAIANFDLTIVAPPDVNTNGLPDSWEALYNLTDPAGDADGDGQSNLAEYLANTNPTNAASALKMMDTQVASNGFPVLKWTAVGGTRYRVQYSNGDANGSFTGVFADIVRSVDLEMDPSPPGTLSVQTYIDSSLLATNRTRFYRVKVVQ